MRVKATQRRPQPECILTESLKVRIVGIVRVSGSLSFDKGQPEYLCSVQSVLTMPRQWRPTVAKRAW